MEKILLFLFRCQVRGLAVFYLSSSLPLPGLQARTDSHPAKIYENVFFYTHKNHTHLSFLRNDILLDVAVAPHEGGQGVQLQRADPRPVATIGAFCLRFCAFENNCLFAFAADVWEPACVQVVMCLLPSQTK